MKGLKKGILVVALIVIILIILFFAYELITAKSTYYINEKNLQIPIFTYHELVENKQEVVEGCMQTTVAKFEKQINGLIKLGYKPISYQDLIDYKNGKKAISKWSFLITFDDGYESFYKYAYPIAQKNNIPMTVFVIDECVGGEDYFSWDKAREMQESGIIAIYSHGLRHTQYNLLDSSILVEETNRAYNNLKKELNNDKIPKIFAYPYGLYTEEGIEKMANNGYVQNLMDSKVNQSKKLNLNKLHRAYPLNDSTFKIVLKQLYRTARYGNE